MLKIEDARRSHFFKALKVRRKERLISRFQDDQGPGHFWS